jgi:hypothetical protein
MDIPYPNYDKHRAIKAWVVTLDPNNFDPLFGQFQIWGEYKNGDRDIIAHRQTLEAAQSMADSHNCTCGRCKPNG